MTLVTVMQSTDFRNGDDLSGGGWLNGPRLRRILLKAKVRAAPMIIIGEVSKMTPKTSFTEHDHVVEALTSDRSDESFHVGTLPGRARCGKGFFYAHCLRLLDERLPKDTIAITQQKTHCSVPRKGFS